MAAFPCPCCGHLVFTDPPGSYDICPVCFWEDDQVQLRWPEFEGGANRPSLVQSQHAFQQLGAIEQRLVGYVRDAAHDEPIEPGWRPIDPSIDSFESEEVPGRDWPKDLTVLYWWRPSFWRRTT